MSNRRRDAEKEEQARKERLAYVGVLAAGLVHEIKTPLHAIQLNAQMLVEDVDKLPTELRGRFERRCNRVHSEVQALSRMLDSFLNFVRPPRFDPTPTDLNHFLREIIEFIQPEMEAADIEIESNLADDMYPVVLDKNQFTQVILNLMRNARESIEAAREKADDPFAGRIVIATAEDEEYICLVIQDNGLGIDPENEERIFEVFYTTKPKGTGLGLGIVKRIVEDHRGHIRLDPIPPPGARFIITLPRGRFLEFKEGEDVQVVG